MNKLNKLNKLNKKFDKVEEMVDIEMVEMTTKLSGIIFRKAELENNFEKVYSRVVKKMVEFEFFGNSGNMLEIFGETGG